jgi:pimeloyl-ACP methyl ester carboxylesterase
MFISPDTIVPDPTQVYDYNLMMYARGNPLKYNDPTGHIAICFHGGPQNDQGVALDASFSQLCSEGLREGGYDPKTHGTIIALKNSDDDIDFALRQILAAQAANPYEPVILVGHSWGGAAAMDLAQRLNDAHQLSPEKYPGVEIPNGPVEVDLLFLLDPENDLRTVGRLYPGSGSVNSPDSLTSNVRIAVNVFAEDWKTGM